MTVPDDNGSEALRKIARRVGALLRKHPPLAKRLRQSWTDYVALHVGYMEERRRREALQRQFAIEIMKEGFLEEQPRKDYEPSWDWEAFYVRVPKQLLARRNAEKDAVKRAPIIAKLAAATLKYLEWDRRIRACPDKVSGKAMWDRMDAAMPIGKFVCENIRVGFRPRVEFSPPPHPLFCKWEEFQTLALPTRVTVALAVLAVLHDELSAVPVLAPLPRYRDDDPEGQLEAIVSDAVRGCLSVTQPREGSSEPPTPDPKRLSIERAEAFMDVLRSEAEALSASAGWAVEEKCPASTIGEAVEWYLQPVLAIHAVFKAVPGAGDPIEANGGKLPVRYMDAMRSRFLGLQAWLMERNHARRGDIIRVAADYSKHGKRIQPVEPFATGKCSIPRAGLDQWEMDVRDLREFAAGVPAGGAGFSYRDEHLTILAQIAAKARLVRATELDGISGMPGYDRIVLLLGELEAATPPRVRRPKGPRSGYVVTSEGIDDLRARDLYPPPK